jgi:glycosyltransferase involved in cell wall biosynthesis
VTTYPVSVCIPTYNYGRYLPQAIDSILNQTFADFELLIIDDCSSDETASVVSGYAARDTRIRFMVNPQRKGMVNNWNACLSEARGKYIKFVFADDLLTSQDAISRMNSVLESSNRISLVSCSRRIVDEEFRIKRLLAPFGRDLTADGPALIKLCLVRQRNLIGEPTAVMFRKSDAARGFLPQFRQIVDQEMWFHILEKGGFAYISEPLVAFRIHPLQQSIHNRREPIAVLDEESKVNEEYLDKRYVRIGGFLRTYVQWDLCYRLWRLYDTKQVDRGTAIEEIERRYGFRKFACFYPIYKTVKPCLKLFRILRPPEASLNHETHG